MKGRWLELVVLALLLAAAGWVWASFADLSRHRFFTIDEYQFGHATWLVSQGQRPYLDFYEHHLPLSYLAHAPLVADPAAGFAARALRLRGAVLAEALGLALVLGASTWAVLRSREAALLSAFLPFAFGFSLLSAVDYRADTLAAYWALTGFALLDANRRLARPGLAAAAGLLLAAACLATQKMAYFAAVPVGLLLLADRLRAARTPFVRRPGAFLGAAALVFGAALLAGGALGMLPAAFERTVLQGLRHEAIYPRVTVGRFLAPFLEATWPSTLPLVALAAVACLFERNRFWLFPLVAALVGGACLRAQYPYNFVLHGLLVGLLAVRGLAGVVERLASARPRLAALRPLLWLAPLAVLPQQLGFVASRTSNEHQLAVLGKIERFSGPGDAVIDGAGAALFRPHGSFYFYHGGAERQLFADSFARELARDYRQSRALFWIRDLRLAHLPEVVQALFREHYVQADGDLFALGFRTPRTLEGSHEVEVEVIREDDYRIFPESPAALEDPARWEVRVDGERVTGSVRLAEGRHRLRVGPGAPALVISPLPPEVFWEPVSAGRVHSPLFEFGVRARPADVR